MPIHARVTSAHQHSGVIAASLRYVLDARLEKTPLTHTAAANYRSPQRANLFVAQGA
jgi:hypothetical protein